MRLLLVMRLRLLLDCRLERLRRVVLGVGAVHGGLGAVDD
jgi:hypothetical protein